MKDLDDSWRVEDRGAFHSGRYGHNNETPILQSFGSIKQFHTYFIPYDMN